MKVEECVNNVVNCRDRYNDIVSSTTGFIDDGFNGSSTIILRFFMVPVRPFSHSYI